MKFYWLPSFFLLTGLFLAGCGGDVSVSVQSKEAFDLQIEYAAIETIAGFRMGNQPMEAAGPFQEIPPIYWHEDIKAMDPVRVYAHHSNVAVILDEDVSGQEGIYICVPFSSYYPEGTESLRFVPITGTTFEMVRVLAD